VNVRPSLTIAQVVEQFELSRATVRRGIESGRFLGATKDDQGRWLVPVDVLVSAGIKPRKTWLNEVATTTAHERAREHAHDDKTSGYSNVSSVATELAHHEDELAQRVAHIAQLEVELAAEKRLRESAERNAEDLRLAMRMLESNTTTHRPAMPENSPRKRWWKRG